MTGRICMSPSFMSTNDPPTTSWSAIHEGIDLDKELKRFTIAHRLSSCERAGWRGRTTDVSAGSVFRGAAVHDHQCCLLGILGQHYEAHSQVAFSPVLLGLRLRHRADEYLLGAHSRKFARRRIQLSGRPGSD